MPAQQCCKSMLSGFFLGGIHLILEWSKHPFEEFRFGAFFRSFALLSTLVQAQTMQSGLYEYTSKTEVMGMSEPMAFKHCVTQKDIDSNAAYANHEKSGSCTPANVTKTGNNIRIKYACTQSKITSEGTGTLRDDGFTVNMKSVMHEQGGMVMNTQLSAQRLGACTP